MIEIWILPVLSVIISKELNDLTNRVWIAMSKKGVCMSC